MILILRGHIRKTFESQRLYNLIKQIYTIDPTLKIYIHTWNIVANNISWRRIDLDNRYVSKEFVCSYFSDLKHLIEDIIVDDDTKIQLIGNLKGTINNGPMPIVGWKNYWYSKYRIIEHIYNKNIYTNEPIINVRFDVLNNSNNFNEDKILDFIKNNSNKQFTKNTFLYDTETNGIDNLYMGNIHTMYVLARHFVYNLDEILIKHNDTIHQERLVFRLNNILFE
jgi:hypothetical protein